MALSSCFFGQATPAGLHDPVGTGVVGAGVEWSGVGELASARGEGELASVLTHEDTATDPDELFYEGTSPESQEMYF